MMNFDITNNRAYRVMLNKVVDKGDQRPSRIGTMFEDIGFSVSVHSQMLLYRPGMARKLGWVESLMVIGGVFDNRLIKMAAPKLVHPYTVHQAYGLKLAQQLPRVVSQLQENPETRRAILHIGQPADGYEEEKPCIQSYQFLQRDGILNMVAYARSWDLVSGFLYDLMVMGLMTQTVARVLHSTPGMVNVFAGSGHVYETDLEKFPTAKDDRKHQIYGLDWSTEFSDWEQAQYWAQDNLRNFGYWSTNYPNGLMEVDEG